MKPFSVTLRETTDKILQVLNESGLPLDVMAMLLERILHTVGEQANEEYKKALEVEKQDKGVN